MSQKILVMVGTQKGAFFYVSDENRTEWQLSGPFLSGWSVDALLGEGLGRRRIWAATSHEAYGPVLRVSDDLGQTWRQLEARPQYPPATGWKFNRIWQLAQHPTDAGTVFAGVEEAGLFVSRDGGRSWRELDGLTRHPSRPKWFPGNGGLCLHTILIDPKAPQRMWVAISSVGVFGTSDGGVSWRAMNRGLP
ncbi:MAG: hypothetical protein RMJ35_02790, partial [Phycisphaerales bacterium]|nr:hypothetical protein [Phycisphaerales bacterium]